MFEEDRGDGVEFEVDLEVQPQPGEEVDEGRGVAAAFVEDCTRHKVRTRMTEVGLEGGKGDILQWNPGPPASKVIHINLYTTVIQYSAYISQV